jgi:two-component system, OmpR family, alkaline phosphatase synthesis response regulator PhoP
VSKRILIADDEPSIVTALEFLLQRAGYEVRVARDGDQTLELVDAYNPDLVLLDVMMPRKSGYEVCTRIRQRPELRHVKIIMLTAKGRDAEVSKGLAMGADLYVTKPFSTRDLMVRIKELVGQDRDAEPA